MKKKLLLLLLSLLSNYSNAQTLVGVQLSSYKSLYANDRLFYGLGINAKHFISEKVAVGLGVQFLTHKSIPGQPITNEYIFPITALAEYHFVSDYNLTPYIGIESGIAIYHNRWFDELGLSNNFIFSPKAGLTYPIGSSTTVFAEGKYNIFAYNNFERTKRSTARFYDGVMLSVGLHFNLSILTEY